MSCETRILVLGASGLLGAELCRIGEDHAHIIPYGNKHGSNRADMSCQSTAWNVLSDESPDVVINLIGHTNVDGCEASPNDAFRLNTKVVENIVSWQIATDKDVKLVQVSTDQVYDGDGLHSEGDAVLSNYYAFSKYAGELAALRVSRNLVCRVNFFGKSSVAERVSFTDWLWMSLETQKDINVFADVMFNPLSMNSLISLIFSAVRADLCGVYNMGSRNGLSKAAFAFEFANAIGRSSGCLHESSLASVGGLSAYRPSNMLMDVGKIEKALGIKMPALVDEINATAMDYTL